MEQEKEAFESGDAVDDEADNIDEEGEKPNYALVLKEQIKALKHNIKEYLKQLKIPTGSARKKGSIKFHQEKGDDTTVMEAQLKELNQKVQPIEAEIQALEAKLKPYDEIVSRLKESKKQLKEFQRKFIKRLHAARETLTDDDCRKLVLDIFNEKLAGHLESYVTAHRQEVIVAIENWWDKYRVTLRDIEGARVHVKNKMTMFIEELGYAKT